MKEVTTARAALESGGSESWRKKEGCGLGSYLLERKRWSGGHILVDQPKKGGKRKGWEYRFLSGSREIVASMDAGSGLARIILRVTAT